jgi:hypothetical protein
MYRHPYDIKARHQLAREHADRLERDMRSARRVQQGPGLSERLVRALFPRRRRRAAAAAAADAGD